jgi:CheY-like chemotaxis protein
MTKKKHSHLLIVEDDATSRLIMRKVLEGAGFSVSETDDIEKAADMAVTEAPSLILLDLVMPRLTGFDYLQIRKSDKVLAKIPVLVTSNLNDRDSVFKAITLGADDYFTKPVNDRVLLQKVLKLLNDKSFFTYKFAKGYQPRLHVQSDQEMVELKVTEVDEFGIKWISPKSFPRGESYNFTGELFREIAGATPQYMTVVSIWPEPKSTSFGGSSEFDPNDDSINKNVRKWLAQKAFASQ